MNLDARFERVAKKPGSKKLVCGQWVEVLPEDDDALACDAPVSSSSRKDQSRG
jgi:hypothetical protein